MEWLKSLFDFARFTLSEANSKTIYVASGTGGATAKAVPTGEGFSLDWVLPYVPLIAVSIAFLKLVFDFYRWRVEREQKATAKSGR